MTSRVSYFALLLALLGVGAISWLLLLRAPVVVEAERLAGIPRDLRGWTGRDVPIADNVATMLDADFHVQRTYRHPVGELVWLYVGYYGSERGGRPQHTPWTCYPSNGWRIVDARVVDPGPGGRKANELIVEKDGAYRLVHFWYRSRHVPSMLGELDQIWGRLLSRIRYGTADGSLVRLSTPLPDSSDPGVARAQLLSFATALAPHLETHWPVERVAQVPNERPPTDG